MDTPTAAAAAAANSSSSAAQIVASRSESLIKLNVGGQLFMTTRETLMSVPDTFLGALASGRLPSTRDETGAFFIDRDPQHFAPILTYLRTGIIAVPPNATTYDLLREAQFFCITPLITKLEQIVGKSEPAGGPNFFFLPLEREPMAQGVMRYLTRHESFIGEVLQRERYVWGAVSIGVHLHVHRKEKGASDDAKKPRYEEVESGERAMVLILDTVHHYVAEVVLQFFAERGVSGTIVNTSGLPCFTFSKSYDTCIQLRLEWHLPHMLDSRHSYAPHEDVTQTEAQIAMLIRRRSLRNLRDGH